jgi:hypothetical protein
MRYGQFFPWNTEEEIIDFFLKPSGLTREQLTEDHPEGAFYAEMKYVQAKRYNTPSGKIEIYSQTLEENSYDPPQKPVEPTKSPISARYIAVDVYGSPRGHAYKKMNLITRHLRSFFSRTAFFIL